jgi:hypothetical protein
MKAGLFDVGNLSQTFTPELLSGKGVLRHIQMSSRFNTLNLVTLLGLSGLALGLAGCGSGPRPPRQAPGDALMAPKEMPALYEGSADFCKGAIKAVVTISKGFGGMHGGPGGAGGSGGHGGRGHGGMTPGGGAGGPPPGGDYYDEQSPQRLGESRLPPVMIHLRFENSSDAPVVLSIWDFKSELGDFAVRPERVTVPAKGSAKVESMTSHLGLSQGEVPVTLRLRSSLGEETRVVKVVLLPEPAQPPQEK